MTVGELVKVVAYDDPFTIIAEDCGTVWLKNTNPQGPLYIWRAGHEILPYIIPLVVGGKCRVKSTGNVYPVIALHGKQVWVEYFGDGTCLTINETQLEGVQ